tara:strand:+ start:13793 stop:14722 length:930 start_codon:yes stop_codon:yes gene_type:complete
MDSTVRVQPKLLIIGDIIIDKYLSGNVSRISPEAPIPILNLQSEFTRFGGAANVAINVSRLIGECNLILDNKSPDIDIKALEDEKINLLWNTEDKEYSVKTRVICGQHQFIRIDKDIIKKRVLKDYTKVLNPLSKNDIILISDYDKGAANCSKEIIKYANTKEIITIVDPKKSNWDNYMESTTLKCNTKEYTEHRLFDGLDIAINEKNLRESLLKYKLKNLIVTMGSEGMKIINSEGVYKSYKSDFIHVYDVSGAGDAVAAGVSFLHYHGYSIAMNGLFLCKLGELCVQEIGTSPIPKGMNLDDYEFMY